MAYSRGQQNFISAVDSRDGYDHTCSRTQNDIHSVVSQQPVNVPVIAVSESRYSSATYPGVRGGPISIPVIRDGVRNPQANSYVAQSMTDPASAKSYRSSVSTQLGSAAQVPFYMGSKNIPHDAVVSPTNSSGSYVVGTSSLPRKRSDGSIVPTDSYPVPVSSQIVYTSRVPGGSSGVAGKVSVASSRLAVYQPGVMSDAVPLGQSRLRQIPVVVMPSSTRPDNSRETRLLNEVVPRSLHVC